MPQHEKNPQPTALLDACVLYPAPLRDALMRLAVSGVFNARWSSAIHDEWTRSVLKNRPDISPQQLNRTRQLMDDHLPEAMVTNYEDFLPRYVLPDPNDRHVLAAAIHAKATCIVTFNLSDFPKKILKQWNIHPIHPDEFICSLLKSNTIQSIAAFHRQRVSLKSPPLNPIDFIQTLENLGLPQTSALLNRYREKL